MDKCEKCVGKECCASKYTFSAWCKNMSKFRIFGKTFVESKKILEMSIVLKDNRN